MSEEVMRAVRRAVAGGCAIAMAMAGGCASGPQGSGYESVPISIFDDASPQVGRAVEVRGYLVWEFENHNLFPDPASVPAHRCLPLLLRNDRPLLLDEVQRLSRHEVVVRGTIVSPAKPGQQLVGVCKQVGIEVESVADR